MLAPSLLGIAILPPLVALFGAIGGEKSCTYIPFPGSHPHYYRSVTTVSPDGRFILEHNFNRYISETIVLGYDARRRRYVRTLLAQDGTYEVAVSPGPNAQRWTWTNVNVPDSPRAYRIVLRPLEPSAYAFSYSNGATGLCRRRR
jgi:hypothetical protein